MRSCLVAYVKNFLERMVCTFAKWRNFCKKGMPSKEIHEDFMETLGNESPFYSTVKKNGQQRF